MLVMHAAAGAARGHAGYLKSHAVNSAERPSSGPPPTLALVLDGFELLRGQTAAGLLYC